MFDQHGDQVRLAFDLVRAAFWLLSRQEEWGDGKRDAFGRFDCSASWLVRHGLAEVPVVNLYARVLAQALVEVAGDAGLPLMRKLPWPHGQRYAVVLSHDVDDAGRFSPRQGFRLAARAAAQRSARGMARGAYYALTGLGHSLGRRPDPYWNFEAVMDLEARAGFRSTFFFVAEAESARRDPPYEVDSPRIRGLLGRLRAGGWEIGVHGSFDSYLDADVLAAHRGKLERLAGGMVRGVRQHYLRLRVPDTFRAQVDAGFVYDGTVGYRGAVGFRAGAAFPYHPFDPVAGRQLALLELPLTVMDGPLFWQLGLAQREAIERTLALLETVGSAEGLAVLLWHQRVWYEKRYPGWRRVYERAVGHLCDEGLAWVATAGQVADWWLAREAVRLEVVSVKGRTHRWRYRVGQAIEGLVLTVCRAGGQRVTVVGAEAAIRGGESEVRLDFPCLAAGQSFEIELTPEVEAS
jgi:peptidoglycan/xylan/chitin deacetylase (PgdA/CDA1 family)